MSPCTLCTGNHPLLDNEVADLGVGEGVQSNWTLTPLLLQSYTCVCYFDIHVVKYVELKLHSAAEQVYQESFSVV